MESNTIDKWIDYQGKEFLKNIGIRKNHFVLDFGCGHGTYSIPASLLVGDKGRIYAVDNNKKSLDELMQRAEKRGLKNIQRIDVTEGIKISLKKESVDAVLLYDVIHLIDNRHDLLIEIHRVSKQNALISVFPKHHQEYMNMKLESVKDEIESAGFSFKKEIYKILMHNDCLEKDYVLNFRKK